MSALILGSISTLVDTSELQRKAFNDAFAQHGLDWSWSREEYRDLLASNGGRDRVASFAAERGEDVDADAVHATKSALFRASLATSSATPRPGLVETVRGARDAGMQVALVTTTSPENVAAVVSAVGPDVTLDLVIDLDDVDEPKPSPAAYLLAMDRLGESVDTCVTVEDNPGGAASAIAAGLPCIAFPNENTGHLDFGAVTATVDRLDLDLVNRVAVSR